LEDSDWFLIETGVVGPFAEVAERAECDAADGKPRTAEVAAGD
jgi:hypothetical protein